MSSPLAAAPTPSKPPKLSKPSKPDWLASPKVFRTEVLAGLVVALALIPEAISFSIIAGVDPAVGLFASFTMAVVISVVGGRKAMISAATGAIALVIAPLNREYGLGYLIAAVILGGLMQIAPRRARRRQAHAVHPALRDGRLRQRPRDPDLHGPGAGDAGRAVGRLPADPSAAC